MSATSAQRLAAEALGAFALVTAGCGAAAYQLLKAPRAVSLPAEERSSQA